MPSKHVIRLRVTCDSTQASPYKNACHLVIRQGHLGKTYPPMFHIVNCQYNLNIQFIKRGIMLSSFKTALEECPHFGQCSESVYGNLKFHTNEIAFQDPPQASP